MENYTVADYGNEFYHDGVKGMRWGVRRYQNKDGSLTPEGKKRRRLGEVVHDHKVAKKRKAALEKARATKAANKEAEEKAKAEAEKRAKDVAAGKISAKKMTDQELQTALTRMQNEQKYKEALLETRPMRKLMSQTWDKAIVPGITEGGKELVKKALINKGSDLLGLDKKEAKSAYEQLKEEADIAKLKKQKFNDTRDLAEAQKKYQKHLDDEARAKAQEQVDAFNKKQSAKDSERDGLYRVKGEGDKLSNPTNIEEEYAKLNKERNSTKNKKPDKSNTSDNVTPKTKVQSEPAKEQAATGKDYFDNFKKGDDIVIDVYVDSNGRAHQAGEEYVAGLLEDKR